MKIIDTAGEEMVLHYVEEGASITPTRITDKEYSKALDAIAPTTQDTLFISPEGKYFLPIRDQKPMEGEHWFIGGKQICGSSVEDTLVVNNKREVGLDVSDKTAVYLMWVSKLYKDREQEPQNKANQTVTHVFLILLTNEDVKNISLNEEYVSESEFWFTADEVLAGDFQDIVKAAVRKADRYLKTLS